MEKAKQNPNTPVTTYKEVKIGNTLYRVTSIFRGEKDLGKTLESLAIRRAMTDSQQAVTA